MLRLKKVIPETKPKTRFINCKILDEDYINIRKIGRGCFSAGLRAILESISDDIKETANTMTTKGRPKAKK